MIIFKKQTLLAFFLGTNHVFFICFSIHIDCHRIEWFHSNKIYSIHNNYTFDNSTNYRIVLHFFAQFSDDFSNESHLVGRRVSYAIPKTRLLPCTFAIALCCAFIFAFSFLQGRSLAVISDVGTAYSYDSCNTRSIIFFRTWRLFLLRRTYAIPASLVLH